MILHLANIGLTKLKPTQLLVNPTFSPYDLIPSRQVLRLKGVVKDFEDSGCEVIVECKKSYLVGFICCLDFQF
jgi:hypothetical protein